MVHAREVVEGGADIEAGIVRFAATRPRLGRQRRQLGLATHRPQLGRDHRVAFSDRLLVLRPQRQAPTQLGQMLRALAAIQRLGDLRLGVLATAVPQLGQLVRVALAGQADGGRDPGS